jgi:diacylglycerol kinase (ATP)
MRVLVRNPMSGDRERSKRAAELARARGYEVRDSTRRGETYALARDAAAEGADLVVACGGDGTLNEVVRGVDDADALSETDLAVVPSGTGNNFADNIGIQGVEHAFEVIETGAVRSLDLGVVTVPTEPHGPLDGPTETRPFINSCVSGPGYEPTPEEWGRTSAKSKRP